MRQYFDAIIPYDLALQYLIAITGQMPGHAAQPRLPSLDQRPQCLAVPGLTTQNQELVLNVLVGPTHHSQKYGRMTGRRGSKQIRFGGAF